MQNVKSNLTRWILGIIPIIGLVTIFFSCSNKSNSKGNEGTEENNKLENALLWKIKGENSDKPSYLFGTLHLMKSDYLDNWPKVKETYQNADKVIVETIIDSSKLMQFGRMMAMKGKTLQDYVDSTEYQKIKSYATDKISYPMSTLDRFKPIQVLIMLSMAEYKEVSTPLNKGDGMIIDQYFGRKGKKRGKKVIELEEFLEQGEMLYQKKSNSEQAEMLVSYINESETMGKTAKSLIKSYENQNLNQLKTLYEKNQEVFKSLAFLLTKRNKKWIKRVKPVFEKGGAFMAVGALHLPGKKGLIKLLRDKGFKVKPMDVK